MSSPGVDGDKEMKTKTKRRKTIHGSAKCSSRWVNLPEDILLEISKRVDPRRPSDFPCRLRSVCTTWRCALRSPPPRRQLKFPITVPYIRLVAGENETSKPIFSVKESTYYLMSPLSNRYTNNDQQQGWIIRVDEVKPRTWCLLNPNDGKKGLFKCTPPIQAEFNLLDYQIQELTRSYALEDHNRFRRSHQVVVSFSPTDDGEVTVIMAIMHGDHLGFWKTGETEWRTWSKTKTIDEIATYKGKFYAVDSNNGNVYVIDPLSIAKTKTFDNEDMTNYIIVNAPLELPKGCRGHSYLGRPRKLVKCEGRLYYIVHQRSVRFDAPNFDSLVSMFVLSEEHYHWNSVMNIKDHVFFLLSEASFALKALKLGRHLHGGWISYARWLGLTYCYNELEHPLYDRDFFKCLLREPDVDDDDPPNKPRLGKMIRFGDLLDKRYTSIFFPPPPGIKWRRVHAARNNNGMIFSMRHLPSPNKDGRRIIVTLFKSKKRG